MNAVHRNAGHLRHPSTPTRKKNVLVDLAEKSVRVCIFWEGHMEVSPRLYKITVALGLPVPTFGRNLSIINHKIVQKLDILVYVAHFQTKSSFIDNKVQASANQCFSQAPCGVSGPPQFVEGSQRCDPCPSDVVSNYRGQNLENLQNWNRSSWLHSGSCVSVVHGETQSNFFAVLSLLQETLIPCSGNTRIFTSYTSRRWLPLQAKRS